MRVLVTRAAGDAARTAARLAERGHEALLAPVLSIEPTGDTPPAGPWDGAILTSAHAVPALADLLAEPSAGHSANILPEQGAEPPAGRPVFVVGGRTAAAARAAGLPPVHVAEGEAASLARLVAAGLPPPSVLLHVAGRHRKPEPEATLRDAGYPVLVWETYEAREASALPDAAADALRTGKLDAVLHYSRRSAECFVRLTEEAGLAAQARSIIHLCLSADVALPFRKGGFTVAVAAVPGEAALLALLDRVGALPP
jgi:uroporphyrinogen-III synthase